MGKDNLENSVMAGILGVQSQNRRFGEIIGEQNKDLTQILLFLLLQLKLSEGMKITEISDFFGMTAGGATAMSDKLEEQGLVTRERSKEDRRIVKVVLTDKGHERVRNIFSRFEEKDLSILDEALKKSSEAMGKFINHMNQKM
ncbi:MarR family winged helix-turn-helix transcriptional regulator [Cytobacillus sp. FJAT-54145]|uniref:MarR family winged helix-turn-helix transcriptional regulator n=1 Tax=Cytobacillus spartinae TaxID=3299023 RepID=A0ABW6KF79_9BACI